MPSATSGDAAGWALIIAMGVCASIVGSLPFSTTRALLIEVEADALELSMVIVGPVFAALALFLVGRAQVGR